MINKMSLLLATLRTSLPTQRHLSRLLLLQPARNLPEACTSVHLHSLQSYLPAGSASERRRSTPLHHTTLLQTGSVRLSPYTILHHCKHSQVSATKDGNMVYKYTGATSLWWLYRLGFGGLGLLYAVSYPVLRDNAAQLSTILQTMDTTDPIFFTMFALTLGNLMMLSVIKVLKLVPITLRYNEETAVFTAKYYTWYLGEEKFRFTIEDVSKVRTRYGRFKFKGRSVFLFDGSFTTAKHFNLLTGKTRPDLSDLGSKQQPNKQKRRTKS